MSFKYLFTAVSLGDGSYEFTSSGSGELGTENFDEDKDPNILGDAFGDLFVMEGGLYDYAGVVNELPNAVYAFYQDGDVEVYSIASDDPIPDGTRLTLTFTPAEPGPGGGGLFDVAGNKAVCFCAGTLIATPDGLVAVETLRAGDLVLSAADGTARPVRWIGRQAIATRFTDARSNLPIRILAGALAEGLPQRDLLVSPQHAIALDGLLVQAGALVNGATVRQEPATALPARFTYFHIELADHALVLAEGVPAETFVDSVTRSRFDNHAEYLALQGDAPAATGEMDTPRVKSPRQLPPAIKARLDARALALRPAAAA